MKSLTMIVAGYKAHMTKMAKHQKMVVAGHKAAYTKKCRQSSSRKHLR